MPAETIAVLANTHGVHASDVHLLARQGTFNAVYALGPDLVLRVPRLGRAFVDALQKELVVPVVRAAGVRTPEIVAFDDSRALLPVPYAIQRRVPGITLEAAVESRSADGAPWRALGGQLAALHERVLGDPAIAAFFPEPLPQPLDSLLHLVETGVLSAIELQWLSAWLDDLDGAAPPRPAFLHGDVQMANIVVSQSGDSFQALIDWGGAGWADPAWDLAGFPLGVVPEVLSGYRRSSSRLGPDAPRRILRRHLQLALLLLVRSGDPMRAWAERPTPMILEIMRFFSAPPSAEWAALRPPSAR